MPRFVRGSVRGGGEEVHSTKKAPLVGNGGVGKGILYGERAEHEWPVEIPGQRGAKRERDPTILKKESSTGTEKGAAFWSRDNKKSAKVGSLVKVADESRLEPAGTPSTQWGEG